MKIFYGILHIGLEISAYMDETFCLVCINGAKNITCTIIQKNFFSLLSTRYCIFLQSECFALFYEHGKPKSRWSVSLEDVRKFRDKFLCHLYRISEDVPCLPICLLGFMTAFFIPIFSVSWLHHIFLS